MDGICKADLDVLCELFGYNQKCYK